MEVEFEDEDLRHLYEDATFRLKGIGPDLAKAFRKVVGLVVSAQDERDLRAMRSLRFEKLEGKRQGQCSLRLNQQWRLIVRIVDQKNGNLVMVIDIVDYH
jgi:toxin HigB-1